MPQYEEPTLTYRAPREIQRAKFKVFKLYLPEDELNALKKFAYARRYSATSFLRALIETYCRQQLEKEMRAVRTRQIQEMNEP